MIEVNASPSLTATTSNDRVLKSKLISDILNIIVPPSELPDARWNRTPDKSALGNFYLLYDEEAVLAESGNKKETSKQKGEASRTGTRGKDKSVPHWR